MSRRTTLFVAGISSRTRARDLAKEFERFGRLVRCDIPAPRSHQARPYAFVEFEDPRDAEDAFDAMQGKNFDGYPLNVQWAKQPPNRSWRYENDPRDRRDRSRSPRRGYGGGERRRSRSPPRRRRSRSRSGERPSRREDERRDDDLNNNRHDDRRDDAPSNGRNERDDRDRSASPRREPEDDDRRRDDDEEDRVRRSPVPSE